MTLLTFLFVFWIGVVVIQAALHIHSISLATIGVPKSLADAGYSGEVVTRRLSDEIKIWQDRAKTLMELASVKLPEESITVTIPKAEMTTDSVAAGIRTFLPINWHKEANGEITVIGNQLGLRLRLNGQVAVSETSEISEIDGLIQNSARHFLERVQPYVVAVALFKSDRIDEAELAADQIVEALPTTDENVVWTYNLKGLIAARKHKSADALKAYRAALEINPQFTSALTNLGNYWSAHNNSIEAVKTYKLAIRYDPNFVAAHLALCRSLRLSHKLEEALASCNRATQLAPDLAGVYLELGLLSEQQHKFDEAIYQYRVAIQHDPKSTLCHEGLGRVLEMQDKIDEAVLEYQTAVRIDPAYVVGFNILGRALVKAANQKKAADRQAILRTACSALDAGLKIEVYPYDSTPLFTRPAITEQMK